MGGVQARTSPERETRKPPIDPATGELARGEVSTWGAPYHAALARAQRDGLPGVGYVLKGEDELVGIDLDGCIDAAGGITGVATEAIALGETYAERSPSGTGVRLFARGHLPKSINRSDLGIEVFGSNQYLTVTGRHINGTPYDIRPAPRTLALLRGRAGVEKNTIQGGIHGQRPGSNDNFWGQVNRAALDGLDRWWRDLFPKGYRTGRSWRAGLTGRGLQEDVAATRDGIRDWGVWDIGDARQGKRSPVELVIEHGVAPDHAQAARWLCDRLGIDPASLGWTDWKSPAGEQPVAPTYPSREIPVEAVRQEISARASAFFEDAAGWRRRYEDAGSAVSLDEFVKTDPPPVHAIRTTPGTSKSQIVAAIYAARRRQGVEPRLKYTTSTLVLAEELAGKLRNIHGLAAKVHRGREAINPSHPGQKMCLDIPGIRLARSLGLDISKSMCRGKTPSGDIAECPHFHNTCSYQDQKRGPQPDVWVTSHENLSHAQEVFEDIGAVVVDENFQSAFLSEASPGISVAELRKAPFRPSHDAADAELADLRGKLARAIDRHGGEIGGLRREHLVAEGVTPDLCTRARQAEYALKEKVVLWPGMTPERRAGVSEKAAGRRAVQRASLWGHVRDFLEMEGGQSGRVFLDAGRNGELVVKTRGLGRIAARYERLPTLILDATMDIELVRHVFPRAEIVADLEASMPHASVRQIVDAPTSKTKMEAPRNFRDVRRYILSRYLEFGGQPTLVICQGRKKRDDGQIEPDNIERGCSRAACPATSR